MSVFVSHLTLALTRLVHGGTPANIPPPPMPSGDYSSRDYSVDYSQA